MKVNANTTITGDKVKLVPYRKEHVPCYHTWMVSSVLIAVQQVSLLSGFAKELTHTSPCLQQDPALQEATASESLSLQVG